MAKGQRVGYIRVSTYDQNPERQLEGTQLDKIYTDKASGKDTQRPRLEALIGFVWKWHSKNAQKTERMTEQKYATSPKVIAAS